MALIDHDSSDPDVGDFITKYEWDFDISHGRTYTDSISTLSDQATAVYLNSGTEPMTITCSLRVTDNNGGTGFEDHDITVNAPIAGNNPPSAVPFLQAPIRSRRASRSSCAIPSPSIPTPMTVSPSTSGTSM